MSQAEHDVEKTKLMMAYACGGKSCYKWVSRSVREYFSVEVMSRLKPEKNIDELLAGTAICWLCLCEMFSSSRSECSHL